jgi:hypothetical protein
LSGDEHGFRVLSILDEQGVPVAGGTLNWVPLRRRLGIRAFGTNAYRAARAGDAVIEEHVESPGQEELYVVLTGRATFSVGGEEVELAAGAALFVWQPDIRRGATALEDETVVLAVGGWPDQPYHSLPWEPIYLAQELMRNGDWTAAADTLEREAGEHRETAILQYRLACCHARLGEHDRALDELRRAIEINPRLSEQAMTEDHLSPLRELDGWPAA